MLSTFVNLLQGSTYQSLYTHKYFHDITFSLQTYILMSWIRIDFCGTRLRNLSYGPPWAHYLGGYQDRLLGGPLGLPGLRCTASDGVKHKDYGGEVLS
jgi:hypothetical protein